MAESRMALFLAMMAVTGGCQPPAPTAGSSASSQTSIAPPPPPPGASGATATTADQETAVVSAYRAAHASQSVDRMLKLYCLDGVSQEMREVVRENIGAELRHPIAAMKFETVPAGKFGPTEEGGIRWRPSLDIVAVLTVDFDVSRAAPGEYATKQAQLAVGKKGSKYYFAAPVRE